MRAEEVKRGVLRFCSSNRHVAVTECTLYDIGGICDVVGMGYPKRGTWRTAGRREAKSIWVLHEYEVKVSLSDLRKDLEKKKWLEWTNRIPVTHFWYAVPKALEKEAIKVAYDLEAKLQGKEAFGVAKTAFEKSPTPSKFKVGVVSFLTEFNWAIVKKAVRVQKEAPPQSVNSVISRAFWELHNLRGLKMSKKKQENMENLKVGDQWIEDTRKRKKRKVQITEVFDNYVRYKNVDSGRKGKSKIAGFCSRYKLIEP